MLNMRSMKGSLVASQPSARSQNGCQTLDHVCSLWKVVERLGMTKS